jgi:hypothetical protein
LQGNEDSNQTRAWQATARRHFYAVARYYRDLRFGVSPIVAGSLDPDVVPRKLGADLIHFLVDIEIASRRALGSTALFEQWKALVYRLFDETAPATVLTPMDLRIIQRCGRIYKARNLQPRAYFQRFRQREA